MERNVPKLRFKGFNDEWTKYKAENLFENISDKNHNGELNVLSVTQDKGVVLRSELDIDIKFDINSLKSYKKVKDGDFIISLRSFQGGIETSNQVGLISPAYTVFNFNEKNKFNTKFMGYIFKSENFIRKMSGLIYGIRDGKAISFKDFSTMNFKIPSLQEQERIANFLTKVDKIIEKQDEKVKNLENYKKGMMQKIFSQEIRFKDENGEEYPEWEETKLGELLTFYSTNSLSRECLNFEIGEVQNIHYGDIHMKFPTILDVKNYSIPYINSNIDITKYQEDSFCKDGDLIIADASEDYADIGKSIEVCNIGNKKILAGLHTILARDNKNLTSSGFKGYMMQCEFVRKQIKVLAAGAKVLGISKANLEKVNIKLPSLQEQQRIADFLTKMDLSIEKEYYKLKELKKWKKGLLQQMFV